MGISYSNASEARASSTQFSEFESKLNTITSTYSEALTSISSELGNTKVSGSWGDEVGNTFVTFVEDLMTQTETIDSDINGGNFVSLKGTVTYLKKALSDLAGYYDKLDEMEGTEPKVYTQYYKYVNGSRVNCTSDDPDKEGSYQANQDAWNNWKTQYDGVIKTIAVTKGNISTNYAKLAGYSFNQTAAPAAPSNADTTSKDSDEATSSQGQVVDGGVIVNGVKYTTVPVGQNLVHGNVDKGDYIVYNGQVYTYGGNSGWNKGLLIGLDGTEIEVTGKELAGAQFVSGYYLSRGTKVDD